MKDHSQVVDLSRSIFSHRQANRPIDQVPPQRTPLEPVVKGRSLPLPYLISEKDAEQSSSGSPSSPGEQTNPAKRRCHHSNCGTPSHDQGACDNIRTTTDGINFIAIQRSHDFSPIDDLTHSHSLIHNPCYRDGIRFPGAPLIVCDGSRATHSRTRPPGRPANPSPTSWRLFPHRSCLKRFHGVSLDLICRTGRPPPALRLAGTRPSPPPGGSPGDGRRRDG